MNVLPNSLPTEKYILGCIMLDNSLSQNVEVLKVDDFYNTSNRTVYETMRKLCDARRDIDIVSMAEVMGNECIGILADMVDSVTTTAAFKAHLTVLKEQAFRRELLKRVAQIQELVHSDSLLTAVDIKNNAMQMLDIPVFDTSCDTDHISTVIKDRMNKIIARAEGVSDKFLTGFYDLDAIMGGWHEQELTIIAARPTVGKTSFALKQMLMLAEKGNFCVMFTQEMSKGQLGERLLVTTSKINSTQVTFAKGLSEYDWKMLRDAADGISMLPIVINDKASTVQEMRMVCRDMKNKRMLDIMFVDYLQLCKTMKNTGNREQEVADMSRTLKLISKEFDIPVIALSQINRESAKLTRRPALYDLRESGALEQDADNVLFLHVPDDVDDLCSLFDIEVIVAKQRNGATGIVKLRYDKKIFDFSNIVREVIGVGVSKKHYGGTQQQLQYISKRS